MTMHVGFGLRISRLLSLAIIALTALAPNGVLAQTTATTKGDEKADTEATQQIIITGTRRTDRTVTDSASPIDVISGTDLGQQPTGNMLDTVKNLVPSFFVGQNTISDASTLVRAPSLRGLPGDEVLVMLNGKRFNRSALVQVYNGGDTGLSFGSQGSDISAIPAIAVKRLDVLRDGATAQYGSDAIAGVLNYGLRDDTGFEISGRAGEYKDHHDGRSYQLSVDGGIAVGAHGFINLAAEADHDEQTSRGATRPLAVVFAQENPGLANQLPNYPLPAQIWGNSPSHGFKILLNSAFDVTDQSQFYLFANVANNKTNESFNFRSSVFGTRNFTDTTGAIQTLGGRSFFQHPYYETQCPANNPTCPAGGYVLDNNTFLLSSIYPAGFTPRFVGKTDQAYGTAGYKGSTSSGLHYDASVSVSRNSLDLSMYDSTSPSYGAVSQTSFSFGKLIQKEVDANLDFSYDIPMNLASPVTLAWGAELRRETYEATQGDLQSYGAGPYAAPHELYAPTATPGVYTDTGTQTATESPAASGYGGTSPTYAGSHSQRSYGVYVDAEADVTQQLSGGLAGRYEHYESFGAATVFKANAIYKFTPQFSARATAGSGFHAPSPGQDNAQVLTTNFINGVSVQTGTYPVTSAIAQYYGARPLKPEYSNNLGAGVVLTPTPQTTLTADYYSIWVRDRIFISRVFTVTPADIAALPELAGVGTGGDVQYFTNALRTRTSGVDLVGTYRMDLASAGKLNWTLAYNYNQTKVTQFAPQTLSPDQIIDAEHLAPNHRANLQLAWTYGDWAVNLAEHYYGSWRSDTDYPHQLFGAKFTTDIDANYHFLEHYTLTAGVSNLFNTYPDRIAATPANPIFTLTNSLSDGQVYPRNGGPFGMNGAFGYVRIRAAF